MLLIVARVHHPKIFKQDELRLCVCALFQDLIQDFKISAQLFCLVLITFVVKIHFNHLNLFLIFSLFVTSFQFLFNSHEQTKKILSIESRSNWINFHRRNNSHRNSTESILDAIKDSRDIFGRSTYRHDRRVPSWHGFEITSSKWICKVFTNPRNNGIDRIDR